MNSPEFQKNVIRNKFQQFIDGMIYLNKHSRSLYPHEFDHLGLVRYMRDMATVDINIGRRTGKTTYIFESSTENDLVVGMDWYEKKRWNMFGNKADVCSYDHASYFDGIYFDGKREPFSTVYLDDFSHFGENCGDNEKFYIDLLQNLAARRLLTKDSTIVRLG